MRNNWSNSVWPKHQKSLAIDWIKADLTGYSIIDKYIKTSEKKLTGTRYESCSYVECTFKYSKQRMHTLYSHTMHTHQVWHCMRAFTFTREQNFHEECWKFYSCIPEIYITGPREHVTWPVDLTEKFLRDGAYQRVCTNVGALP